MTSPDRLLLVALLLGLAGCGTETPPEAGVAPTGDPPGEAAGAAFVGMAVCAECHAAETTAWTGSHHDLAMAPANDATVLGNFDNAEFEHGGVTSRFFRRDEKYLVSTDGPDGKLAEYELKWTFGEIPLQQYLVEFPDGRLQALGTAWDTREEADGGQRWFHVYGDQVIPAGDELHWTGPAQNWNYMCADCHSTAYRKNYDPRSDTFAATWSDVDVACEACHGPGSIHAARARAGRLSEGSGLSVSFALQDRTRLFEEGATTVSIQGGADGAKQVESCGRCHARRAPISGEYAHGKPLLDSYLPALLTQPLYFADGQIQDEVYVYGSFRQSRMYAAGVVCTDCHEPHSLALRAEGDAVCAQCHLPNHYDTASHSHHPVSPEAPGCVDCHMPARTYMVVDPRRDHSFRVPRPDLAAELGVPDACDACHADRPSGWSATAVRGWLGRDAAGMQDFAAVFAAARAGQLEAGEELRLVVADMDQPAIVRATALELLRGYPAAGTLQAAARALADPDPAVRLAALGPIESLPITERSQLVMALLSDPVRGVRIEAARLLAAIDATSMDDAALATLQAAMSEYIETQHASLDRPSSRFNLGNFYAAGGETEAAAKQYSAALAVDPDFEPAYVNLAQLLAMQGDSVGASEVLNRGLAVLPGSAALHHALGLHRIRAGDRAGALGSLARAVELAPDNPRFSYVYAVALDNQGQREKAIALLERTHDLRPADQDVLWALVSMLLQSGDIEAGTGYARQLGQLRPENPEIQRLLGQLGAD